MATRTSAASITYIYTADLDWLFFHASDKAKHLLQNSITQTTNGYTRIGNGQLITGVQAIVIGRVKSAAAFGLGALSAAFMAVNDAIWSSCYLIVFIPLNLISRLPGITSFWQWAARFTQDSNDEIYRTFRVNVLGVPIVFLFLTEAALNTLLPGLLKSENIFVRNINWLASPLGRPTMVRVTNANNFVGALEDRSLIAIGEDYVGSFSSDAVNAIQEIQVEGEMMNRHTRLQFY